MASLYLTRKNRAKGLNTHFSKDDTRTVNKYMKKRPTSLITREMQIKTPMRYHLTTVRIAVIKKTRHNQCPRGCREKETLVYCGRNADWYSNYSKEYWMLLKKLKTEQPYDPAVSLLGIQPRGEKSLSQRDSCIPMFTATLFTQQLRYGNNLISIKG